MSFGTSIKVTVTLPVPPKTMPWVWSCHKCHTRYPLGATRRCLHDGHYFCGGITLDKVTGKSKKHRACASEFDYMGWEHVGNWRRAQWSLEKRLRRNCENQCDFPSACHWKAKHVSKKGATFSLIDPRCMDGDSKAKDDSPKKTGLDRVIKSVQKRSSQFTNLLSTIDDESNFATTPGSMPPKPTIHSAQPQLPELNLSFPVMVSSSSKRDFDAPASALSSANTPTVIIPQSPPPPASAIVDAVASQEDEDEDEDVDIDMTDWLSQDSSPNSNPDAPFDFSIDIDEASSSADDEASPISPTKSAWEWTAGDIGIALSPPVTQVPCREPWDEQIDDEGDSSDDLYMLWERDVDRRVSV